jgi:hypothetical protein
LACPTADCGPGDPQAERPFLVEDRVEGFFRLDVRFEKRWHLSSGTWIAVTLEWFNALLAEEKMQKYWDPMLGVVEDSQSPLTLPSIGVEAGY